MSNDLHTVILIDGPFDGQRIAGHIAEALPETIGMQCISGLMAQVSAIYERASTDRFHWRETVVRAPESVFCGQPHRPGPIPGWGEQVMHERPDTSSL